MNKSKTVLIDIIAGARPNFMKVAAIINAIKEHQSLGGKLQYRLVHTGQHYDKNMSGDFFTQLGIPEPDINLEVGSGTQAELTAGIMIKYEKLLLEERSDLCLVVGDITSTLACAITAQKLCIPVAHVEAGIRSGDWTMPEEINRMVTDSITNWFFTTTKMASQNIKNTGVEEDRIFFVGNTMIDTLLTNMDRLSAPDFYNELKLSKANYIVVTLHRPSNVDDMAPFNKQLNTICKNARDMPIIFPVHPRSRKTLEEIKNIPNNLILVDPQPYLQFNYLVKNSFAVITDSGGITEETTVMGIPCLTLRDSTERPETISIGTNELIGTDPNALKPAMDKLFDGKWKKGDIPEKWDGDTGDRIVKILNKILLSPTKWQ